MTELKPTRKGKLKVFKAVYAKPVAAHRTCLKCQRTFDSVGPQNRLCPHCLDLIRIHNITE
jgi:5-methylcytosine-specific restriction endonuclease McrBC regulatory subunit McrC